MKGYLTSKEQGPYGGSWHVVWHPLNGIAERFVKTQLSKSKGEGKGKSKAKARTKSKTTTENKGKGKTQVVTKATKEQKGNTFKGNTVKDKSKGKGKATSKDKGKVTSKD